MCIELDLLDFTGFCTRFDSSVTVFFRIHLEYDRISITVIHELGFIFFYLDLPKCTGFYLVLLSCTLFH